LNSGLKNSNDTLQDLINKQQEIIQKQGSELQRLQSEMQKKDEKIVKQNEELVTLNEKISQLSRSDLELQECKKIKASAAEERLTAAREKAAADRQKEKNTFEEHRLLCMEQRLKKDKQKLDQIVRDRVESLLVAKQKKLCLKIAAEWHSSLMLILYSLVMTLYFVIIHWQTFLTGDVFFIRLATVFTGIWEVAWPSVLHYWFSQFQSDTGALVATTITAALAAGIIVGAIKLFLKWKHRADATYDSNDKRKIESFIFITSASLILALIICAECDLKMSWITLWILLSFGANFIYQTVRIFRYDRNY